MSNHTPGPWEWQNGSSWWRLGTRGNDGNVLCPVVATYDNHPDLSFKNHADKALIAAAPDLLEALREVVRISDRKHNAWDKAHAAIAKAEGRQ